MGRWSANGEKAKYRHFLYRVYNLSYKVERTNPALAFLLTTITFSSSFMTFVWSKQVYSAFTAANAA